MRGWSGPDAGGSVAGRRTPSWTRRALRPLSAGRVDVARLRRALTTVPVPRAADGRLVLAADLTCWLRPRAHASPQRILCHNQQSDDHLIAARRTGTSPTRSRPPAGPATAGSAAASGPSPTTPHPQAAEETPASAPRPQPGPTTAHQMTSADPLSTHHQQRPNYPKVTGIEARPRGPLMQEGPSPPSRHGDRVKKAKGDSELNLPASKGVRVPSHPSADQTVTPFSYRVCQFKQMSKPSKSPQSLTTRRARSMLTPLSRSANIHYMLHPLEVAIGRNINSSNRPSRGRKSRESTMHSAPARRISFNIATLRYGIAISLSVCILSALITSSTSHGVAGIDGRTPPRDAFFMVNVMHARDLPLCC